MSYSYLKTVRKREFASPDSDVYLHLGHFFAWYAHVDFVLTLIVAVVVGSKDLESLHQLTMGMDAKTKVIRLTRICKVKKREIGPNLVARFKFFRDTLCPLRDRLSHTALVRGETVEMFYFQRPDRMAWRELGMDSGKAEPPADSISHLELFERGNWMHEFNHELGIVLNLAIAGQSLEIAHPRSMVPPATPASSPTPDD